MFKYFLQLCLFVLKMNKFRASSLTLTCLEYCLLYIYSSFSLSFYPSLNPLSLPGYFYLVPYFRDSTQEWFCITWRPWGTALNGQSKYSKEYSKFYSYCNFNKSVYHNHVPKYLKIDKNAVTLFICSKIARDSFFAPV